MSRGRRCCRLPTWLLLVGLCRCVAAEEPEVFRLPDGFRLERVADHQLVPDATCLTLDPAGHPVVAGPGYIRTLLMVDSATAGPEGGARPAHSSASSYARGIDWLVDLPREAPHGLHREGDQLYYVADGGLWRSTADAGGLRAATSPQRLLPVKTGGEHDTHALRRGPDGWWYLLAGNMATGIDLLLNDSDSPVAEPRAGTLWRISPDWSRRTVWAHGLRNAYGFDFLPDGRPVTFDSDGERDISLPWYRPTRLLLLNAGSDAGFVTRAWKDDDHRPTMPTVLARLGRGSPTGVLYYDHPQFPAAYRRKIIVLDWTFGRVLAVDPWGEGQGETPVEVLVEPAGMVGFAPTGVVVEPSGSLLISVGGRGTRGGLYRLSYCAGDEGTAEPPMFRDPVDHSPDRLDAPVEPAHFRGGLRQAQQLVASGGRVPGESIDALLSDPDLQRQSAAWYLLGRRAVEATPEQSVRWSGYSPPTLRSGEDASVPSGGEASQQLLVRLALELEARGLLRWSLGGWTLEVVDEPHGENETIFVQLRQLELWCRSRQADASQAEASWSDVLAGGLYASVQQRDRWMQAAPGLARLDPNQLPTNRRQAIEQMTALQLTHGELRWELPGLSFTGRAPSIFDGYRGGRVSGWSDAQLSAWSSWLKGCGELAAEHGWDEVLEEALRTLAILGLHDGADGDWVASWLDQDRPPSFQVLCMLVLAAGPAPLSNRCQQQLIESWLGLDETLRAWGAQVDHHWEPRLLELFEALLAGTPDLAMRLVEHPSFGTKNQAVAWWVRLPEPAKTVARGRMLEDLLAREPATWSAAQLQFVLEGGLSVELRPALHRAAGVPHLQRLVYRQLAASPEQSDHAILVAGLGAPGRELPLDAWRGLQTLGPPPDPVGELPALLELLVRSENAGWTEPDRSEMVERLAALFQRLGLAFPLQATRYRADAWIDGAREHLSDGQSGRLLQLTEVVDWATRLARIKQLVGEPGIGQGHFERAGCGACHGGGLAPGPDLKGVTQRFALPDLMRAIYDPSADVSDRYRPLQVLTQTGQVVIGLPIYRSVDGVTLQTAQGETLRINQDEIERLEPAERSLMPDGLLDGWSDQQLADLLAYLRQL